jgi:heme A synthase
VLGSAWGAALLYNLSVILFGAYVRISKSGDGCGQHWPTCHGEVLHLPRRIETVIELTHRVTSGLSLLLVVVLAVVTLWVQRFRAPHPARLAAKLSLVFIVAEALVGAVIVLLRLVGSDSSASRAVVMAVHLVNTCLLTFSLLFAAWSTAVGAAPRFSWGAPRMRRAWLGAGLLLVVSAAGAVTALGDTLFPLSEHQAALSQVASESSHFLERSRGFHPLLAIGVALYLLASAPSLGTTAGARVAVTSLVLVQVALGFLNVVLSAPGWMQVVHLGAANLLWLAWVWLSLETAQEPTLE